MTGPWSPVRVGLALTAGLALLSGCTSGRPAAVGPDPAVPALRLVAFDSCADLLDRLRAAAKESVGPYGLPGDGVIAVSSAGRGAPLPATEGSRDTTSKAAGPVPYSGTNTHEAAADEPDVVKTDGRRIVTVSRGVLRVVDIAARKVTGSLPLGNDYAEPNLLLAGDHALVLTTTFGTLGPGGGSDSSARPTTGARLILVDLVGAPREIGRYAIGGSLVDARQVGSVARVVVRSTPSLAFPMDAAGDEAARAAANRRVVAAARVEAWLPRYEVSSGTSRRTGRVDCRSVSRPSTYSGSSLLTVLTFDLNRSTLDNGDPVSVVADGDAVYSNGPRLYVATDNRWKLWPGGASPADPASAQRTDVYRFDISGTGRPRYVAGGSVPGWLVSQYAMSEWDGKLRIATTVGQVWDGSAKSSSTVYVLGSSLEQLGKVGGLGRGERIYAVRFIGPTGYVVTFRQVDPLYAVDLRDPRQPKVAGELKINGYSAYLHPAGEGRLIGVGQEADDAGRRMGTQVSLFDVTDPAHAGRLARYAVPGGYSEAELDPHALLYWPATGLLVIPLVAPGPPARTAPPGPAGPGGTAGPAAPPVPVGPTASGGSAGSAGAAESALPAVPSGAAVPGGPAGVAVPTQVSAALALRVTRTTLTGLGTIRRPTGEPIRRSMAIGDELWTLSSSSLSVHSLASLAPLAEVPLS